MNLFLRSGSKNVCGQKGLTHINSSGKKRIDAKWRAAQPLRKDSKVAFLYTIVENYSNFWVKATAAPVLNVL